MIGILGGTFDPPHWGHVRLAKNFIDLLGLTELIWLPAGQPWQKSSLITPSQVRYEMTCAAAQDLQALYPSQACPAKVSVSRIEIDRQGPSYTMDTAKELRSSLGASKSIIWLMGADTYQNLQSWHDWQKLPEYFHLAVASRQISPLKDLAYRAPNHPQTIEEMITMFDQRITLKVDELSQSAHGKIIFDEKFNFNLSSTDLREQLQTQKSSDHLGQMLSPQVLAYIFKHGTYAN